MRQERIRTQFTTQRPHRPRRSRAFTLIEILVVVVIIGLLTSILLVASMSVIGSAREAATKATITKIEGMLRPRIEAYNRTYARDVPLDAFTQTQNKYGSLSPTNDKEVLKVLTRKDLFRKYFPQTWAEVHDALMITDQEFKEIQKEMGSDTSAESSEVLYFMLTSGRAKGYETVAPSSFTTAEALNKSGSTRPEFIDSWGKPLRFYRWSTRLIRPSGLTGVPSPTFPAVTATDVAQAKILISNLPDPSQLGVDPDDPVGMCNSALNSSFKAEDFEAMFTTPSTYSTPLIVSAGPDGELGLHEPNDSASAANRLCLPTTNAIDLNDNITNRNMRSGGN